MSPATTMASRPSQADESTQFNALYKKGAARPTGGAGCVAMLVGPDAPLAFEPGLRGSYMTHAYDFYKADLTSEYPLVDGHFSIKCYSEAVDACYKAYNEREKKVKSLANGHATNGVNGVNGTNGVHTNGVNGTHAVNGTNGVNGTHEVNGVNGTNVVNGTHEVNGTNGVNGVNGTHAVNGAHELETPLDRFDHMIFHSPTCKLVSKSYGRLLYNDYLANPDAEIFKDVPAEVKDVSYDASITDKTIEKTFVGLSKKRFAQRVQPGVLVPTMCGNMYTASVYSSLVSLISNVTSENLQGKRVAVFSYGSGLAASMFSFKVRGSTEEMAQKVDLHNRLNARNTVAPEVYDEMCNMREHAHLKKNYTPVGETASITPGTYYLTDVDDMFRRKYEIKQ